jgi:hypothetical protein
MTSACALEKAKPGSELALMPLRSELTQVATNHLKYGWKHLGMEIGSWWSYGQYQKVEINEIFHHQQLITNNIPTEFADPPPASPTPDPAQSVTENLASLKTTDQMESKPKTLLDWAVLVLNTSNPEQKVGLHCAPHTLPYTLFKVARTRQAVSEYRTGKITSIGRAKSPLPPETPPREDLRIVEPSKVTKRGKAGTVKSRIAILHALANIEQWA